MCSLLLFLLSRDEKRQENSLKARLSSASRRLSLDEAETNTEENPTSVANEVTVSHLLKKELIIQLLYKWLRSKTITPLISSQHACLALHSTKGCNFIVTLSHLYTEIFYCNIFLFSGHCGCCCDFPTAEPTVWCPIWVRWRGAKQTKGWL